MTRFKTKMVSAISFLGLAGCVATQMTAVTNWHGGRVELIPQVTPGRFTQTKTLNTVGKIATLSITPYIASGSQYYPIDATTGQATDSLSTGIMQVSLATPSLDLSQRITLPTFRVAGNYRFIGRAYDTQGTQISDDAASQVSLAVNEQTTACGTLPLRLLDQTFSATQTIRVSTSPLNATTPKYYLVSISEIDNGVLQSTPLATYSIPGMMTDLELGNLAPKTYRIAVQPWSSTGPVTTATPSISTADITVSDEVLPIATFSFVLPH